MTPPTTPSLCTSQGEFQWVDYCRCRTGRSEEVWEFERDKDDGLGDTVRVTAQGLRNRPRSILVGPSLTGFGCPGT